MLRTLLRYQAGLLVAGFCGLALVPTPTIAAATTIGECHAVVDIARGELAGVEIGGRNPDQTRMSLESKLDGADLKLDQGKFPDARLKLTQFRDKVVDLESQRKVTDGTSTVGDLLAAADDAVACVDRLIAGQ